MSDRRELCTFTVGDLFLGMPTESVQDTFEHRPMTRVPLAGKLVHGLINVEGRIVTAIDMRLCLGYPPYSPEDQPMNLIARPDGRLISLLVDSVGDVIAVDASAFEAVPGTVHEELRQLLAGVYKQPEGLILALRSERVLELACGVAP